MAKRIFEQGVDVDPVGTNRVAHGKAATVTANSTWNTIVTWLRTALQDTTHRFATDTEKSTWNAKMEDTKAAIEARLTGIITSHTHPVGALNSVTINSGDWDMEASPVLTVPHGLPNIDKIRGIDVIVRADVGEGPGGRQIYKLEYSNGGNMDGGIDGVDDTNITLRIQLGGFFNSVAFNSTSYNRAYITIRYAS